MVRSTAAWCGAVVLLLSCSKQSQLGRDLLAAVARGDAVAVSALLDRGGDADSREPSNPGRFALAIAAEEDHLEIAALLIARGAQVNARSNDGNTPLMYASGEGNRDMARLLLDRGADINAADNLGQTPLIKAAADGHDDVVALLLERGAGLDARDESGHTAVMKAMINGHMEMARLLQGKGARITREDRAAIDETARMSAQGEEIDDIDDK